VTDLHLAAALNGAGWHPAAWRAPDARPGELFTAGYWTGLVTEAEHGQLDFVTFEDSLGLQSSRFEGPDERVDQVRGRLDAVLLAARAAPLTSGIGLVPTTSTTHTEPFHVAIGIATLDHISRGRAGWRPQISGRSSDARHFGRREFPEFGLEQRTDPVIADHVSGLFAEATDAVEAVRRLWDSWEDDAEIRDVATDRFIDRDKLHYINFEGPYFSVKGPSITPRPPQGQPLITALAHDVKPYEFAARGADIVYVTPHSREQATAIIEQVRAAETNGGRDGEPLKIFADLVVFLDDQAPTAAARKNRLDDLDGSPFTSDALIVTATPEDLADLLLEWRSAGVDGFRLRPGVLPDDLLGITRGLVPELRRRGAFRHEYEATTLRGLLGLSRPANRYTSVEGAVGNDSRA
jgi:alkanesulfonate monooxygenase SsuD/methylene tetrahydromethanopterin reductase-like flavin-dependent oxidoreductase (luciferase family)